MHSISVPKHTGNKFVAFLRDSIRTEILTAVRVIVAPFQAIPKGSTAPLKDAVKLGYEDGSELAQRYTGVKR